MGLIIIYHFILVFWGALIGLFGEKIIRRNPFFKCFIVKAEIVDMVDFSMLKKHFWITVVKYQKHDMTLKTFVYRGRKDQIGDMIEIATNGDLSVRTKFYWRKDNVTVAGVLFLILTILGVWLLIACMEIIEMKYLLIALFVLVILLFLHPLLYGIAYNDIQGNIHTV